MNLQDENVKQINRTKQEETEMANKLSNAQAKVLERAKKDIDDARSMNFYDWFRNRVLSSSARTDEEIDKRDKDGFFRGLYEDNKNGIAHTYCNGRTIEKLEKLGLIEIIYNGTNKRYPFDHVKVLNY